MQMQLFRVFMAALSADRRLRFHTTPARRLRAAMLALEFSLRFARQQIRHAVVEALLSQIFQHIRARLGFLFHARQFAHDSFSFFAQNICGYYNK